MFRILIQLDIPENKEDILEELARLLSQNQPLQDKFSRDGIYFADLKQADRQAVESRFESIGYDDRAFEEDALRIWPINGDLEILFKVLFQLPQEYAGPVPEKQKTY